MILKNILTTGFILVFTVSVSGTSLTVCPSQINGRACLLICETADFSQTVTFRKDGVSAGACLSSGTCGTSVSGYIGPYRIGTTQTVLNISSYSITRDIGEWTCSLGASPSPSMTMHYAIPPTSASITAATNFTVNSTAHITITTECAYINISGIIHFENTSYNQSQSCTALPSGGCASGAGEKYTCTFTLEPSDVTPGTHLLLFRVDLPYDNTNPEVPLTTQVYLTFPESTKNRADFGCSELYVLLILLIDAIAFIVLLYIKIKKIEKLDYVKVVNIAQNCCGKRILIILYLECAVMLVLKVLQFIIVVPILIVTCKCPVDLVIGIAILLIFVCPVIYMSIFWVVIWCVCCRKTAVNRVDSEIIKESPRKSINGDAGLSSPVTPGRKLPPLPPLTRTELPHLIPTDPDKLVNTEKKKKKKKTKTEVNEEDQAETNKSEINDQVDAENLPETNKISD